MQKMMLRLEICGIFFVIVMSVFLQNLYELSNHTLIGIMFGSVNDSIWETTKTILFPVLLWGMIELLCVHPPFYKFAVIKIMSMYFTGILFVLMCVLYSASGSQSYSLPEFTAAVVCISMSAFFSYKALFSSIKFEMLFAGSFFMLLLFVAFYCSFTPFPPHHYVFMDRATTLYGIIPNNIDMGAVYIEMH